MAVHINFRGIIGLTLFVIQSAVPCCVSKVRRGGFPFPLVLTAVCSAAFSSLFAGQPHEAYDRARNAMVREFLEKEGIRNPRVLAAMRTVPRHEFVPYSLRSKAYTDSAWPIGYRQTISPPFVVAYMTEALEPRPTDHVLEIGTGSGYQAAVLSLLVSEVYTIEIVDPLGRSAEKRLKHLGYRNVKVKVGDGYAGWPQYAPFDKIIVTCSPENVPQPLVDQLKEGGRIVIPLGERYHQDVYLLEKKEGKLVRKQLIPTLFVPMTGRSEKERTVKPDPLHPRINNGGFEEREPDGRPSGWHYQRQLTLVEEGPPEGRYCARFDNEDPGRIAQALQGLAVDGRRVAELRWTLKVRGEGIRKGAEVYQRASLEVQYYNENRQPVNDVIADAWSGTFDWRTDSVRIVVPEDAREAVVRIGLNGAIGRLYVDDVQVEAFRR